MLSAALDGVDRELQPSKPLNNINVYNMSRDERQRKHVVELPGSLLEALSLLDQDKVIKNSLGESIYSAFVRAKQEEWEDYRLKVMDWEVKRYLETT
jgi:glutamine synthetase